MPAIVGRGLLSLLGSTHGVASGVHSNVVWIVPAQVSSFIPPVVMMIGFSSGKALASSLRSPSYFVCVPVGMLVIVLTHVRIPKISHWVFCR